MTLTELNALEMARLEALGIPEVRTQNGWTLRRSIALGRCGRQVSRYRGTTGSKLHLLHIETVEARPADAHPGDTLKVGANYSLRGCANNGQRNGVVLKDQQDLSAVSCSKCQKRLAEMLAANGVTL